MNMALSDRPNRPLLPGTHIPTTTVTLDDYGADTTPTTGTNPTPAPTPTTTIDRDLLKDITATLNDIRVLLSESLDRP